MNRSISSVITASLALCAASAFAHEPPTTTNPDNSRPDEVKSQVTLPTETGSKTIRSGMPAQADAGPAPAFAVLDKQMRGYLDESDAEAYPLLSTDFIKADGNRDGKVSKEEYERWAKQP